MKLKQIKENLNAHPLLFSKLVSADDEWENGFHITEVGQIVKQFVDCGGTWRSKFYATAQIWWGDDKETHCLRNDKIVSIIDSGNLKEDLELVVELGTNQGIWLMTLEIPEPGVIFLSPVMAACLAPEKCGLQVDKNKCSGKGCC